MSTSAPPVRRGPAPDVVLPTFAHRPSRPGPTKAAHDAPGDLPDDLRVLVRGACSPAAHAPSKRVLDVVVAVAVLVVAAPVLAVVALLVALTSDGPVLFRQERVGAAGRSFRLHKFRTMHVDGVPSRAELVTDRTDAGPLFKMAADPRVTRVGRVLRRHSLDELPQLWNVLRGDMSLVGPRPALPSEVACYDEHALRRLAVKPGLTGPWQVGGRSDLSWDDGLRLDLDYVDRGCLRYDLKVLVATVGVVLRPVGAY